MCPRTRGHRFGSERCELGETTAGGWGPAYGADVVLSSSSYGVKGVADVNHVFILLLYTYEHVWSRKGWTL